MTEGKRLQDSQSGAGKNDSGKAHASDRGAVLRLTCRAFLKFIPRGRKTAQLVNKSGQRCNDVIDLVVGRLLAEGKNHAALRQLRRQTNRRQR